MRRVWGVVVAAAERFYNDNCFMRASALAYVSLLSIVPLLAVMFSALKGLGVQRRIEPLLLSRLSLHPETTAAIMGFIDQTNFGTLGAFAGITLLLTIYSLLGSVEASFNDIWRVAHGRSYLQQATHYFGVVLLTPFLLVTAVALTSSLQVEQLLSWLHESQIMGRALVGILGAVPIVMNIFALAVLYAVMPNRRPYPSSVLLGAIVAGIGWHVVQVAYVRLQIGMARYNAVYGALSQLPVTLVWQYVSWVIVLAGAELAAVYEYGIDRRGGDSPRISRLGIALELLVRAVRTFESGGPPVSARQVARDLRIAFPSADDVARWLVERRWLVAVQDGDGQYVLAAGASHIRLGALAELLGSTGPPPAQGSAEVRRMLQALGSRHQAAWNQWTLADALTPAPAEVVTTKTPENRAQEKDDRRSD